MCSLSMDAAGLYIVFHFTNDFLNVIHKKFQHPDQLFFKYLQLSRRKTLKNMGKVKAWQSPPRIATGCYISGEYFHRLLGDNLYDIFK